MSKNKKNRKRHKKRKLVQVHSGSRGRTVSNTSRPRITGGWVPGGMVHERELWDDVSGTRFGATRMWTGSEISDSAVYFAYGSNLNLGQMKDRCPAAKLIGPAVLQGWRLAERTHADIEQHEGGVVHGALFSITRECEQALDRYEGVSGGYYEKVDVTVDGPSGVETVMTYRMAEMRESREGSPFSFYYAAGCALGAIECGIPVWVGYARRAGFKVSKPLPADGFVRLTLDATEG